MDSLFQNADSKTQIKFEYIDINYTYLEADLLI